MKRLSTGAQAYHQMKKVYMMMLVKRKLGRSSEILMLRSDSTEWARYAINA